MTLGVLTFMTAPLNVNDNIRGNIKLMGRINESFNFGRGLRGTFGLRGRR